MRIRVVRNTLVAGMVVDAGSVIDVNPPVAQQLIAMGKAVAVTDAPPPAPHLAGIQHADDVSAMTAERRTDWGAALVGDLDGVGPVTARLLGEAGIETMADLLAVDATELALLARVSPAKAEKWRQRADAIVRGAP